jgi:hypothetical protein
LKENTLDVVETTTGLLTSKTEHKSKVEMIYEVPVLNYGNLKGQKTNK